MASKTVMEIVLGMKSDIGSKLKGLQGKLKTFKGKLKEAFNSKPALALKVAIVAIGTALVASVVSAAKFNVQMARVWTMAGGGIKTFQKLRKEARGLAGDFGLARSSVAKGMYNALSAGVDKSNMESFMSTAAKVAVADGSDISVAVDGITTVLNAFGYEAEQTEQITDQLFQTVKQGKTTFSELAANLATVAPVAAASNIPLKQILAHVAQLTAQGTPTAQAMTQIRASIQGLNKALGDGWSKQFSYQHGLKKVWNLAGKSQNKLLKMVGSIEGVQAVLGGVGEKADSAMGKLTGMSESAGAAEEAYDKVAQFRHWPTLLETARGAVSKFGEEVDKRVKPHIESVTEQLKKWRNDPELWKGITDILDHAEKKLDAAAEIIKQIESVEDLGTVGEIIGDWLKEKLLEGGEGLVAFLSEKAGEIGAKIGEGIWDFVQTKGSEGAQKTGDFLTFGFTEQRREYKAAGEKTSQDAADKASLQSMYKSGMQEDLVLVSPGSKTQASDAGREVDISETSLTSLSERLISGLQANHADDTEKEIYRIKLPDHEMIGDAEGIQEIIDDLKITDEALGNLAQKMLDQSKASKATAEAATKSADASVEAQGKVTDALTRVAQAQVPVAQAAVNAQSAAEQAIAMVQELAQQQANQEQRLATTESQIVSMRT